MSNFDFLRDFDEELWKAGNLIEEQVNISPGAVKSYATPFLERVLTILMERIGRKFNSRKEYYDQLDAVYHAGIISHGFKVSIYDAYQLRSRMHGTIDEVTRTDVPIALQLHRKLYNIAKKLYRDFNPNYDHYKGVPAYKPVEIDTSDDEVELLEIPDFSEIIEIKYDYCVICGEPNHSNYSLCCPKCNQEMDNANNFISIRNYFGKDATFRKEDLIEYGIAEGYVNQLVSSLVRENMLRVRGLDITFNNMYVETYLAKIDRYISICELITRFREDKITPDEIKRTAEYKQGSFGQEPFHQFYVIVNREIVRKFEKYILETQSISESIEFSTITPRQLRRWYGLKLTEYRKGNVDESFIAFNELLIEDYLELKRQGMHEKDIRGQLNIGDETYGFMTSLDSGFEERISQIKVDLISRALIDGKTKVEIIEIAGVTPREYEDLVKVSKFRNDEFGQLHDREVESRKEKFIGFLRDNDLRTSCELAKISVEDFYDYYENANQSSEFFTQSTQLLMDKYLSKRREGKTKSEAIEGVGLKEIYVERWHKRTMYKDFRVEDMKITVGLIIDGFKSGKSMEEISRAVDVRVDSINWFINVGSRDNDIYKPLYDYYEAEILPKKLSEFMSVDEDKPMRKAFEMAELNEDEVNRCYELGKSGDERFIEFYERVLEDKKGTYAYHRQKGKSHNIAMKESMLTQEEYDENRDDLDKLLRLTKFMIVIDEVRDKKTSNVAATKARCSVDDIYEWYFRGRDGEEDYVQFYDLFHGLYVRPNINSIQEHLDYKNQSLENILKANKDQVTKRDIEIWVEHGLLNNKVLKLNKEENEKETESKFDANEMLREMGVEDYDRILIKKSSNSSSILTKHDDDVEELKKQILKK